MPKIKCYCGNIIGLGEIPNPNGYLVISEIEYENFGEFVNSGELYMKMISMIRCNKCERLYIYWNKSETEATVYKLEENNLYIE